MAISSATRKSSGPVLRSLSPSGRFHGGATSSAFASSTSSTFTSRTTFLQRRPCPSSPTRINLSSPSTPVRFNSGLTSPNRSISSHTVQHLQTTTQKKTCMCSPTNHPGSFRCSLHKTTSNRIVSSQPYQSNRLFARRSAMTNSLVRIGTVEGDIVKRALASLIRPSLIQQRRRCDFQPRKSRFSVMAMAVQN